MPTAATGPNWRNLTAVGGAPLPDWAQFMLDLGRVSGVAISEEPAKVTWRIVTVPNRNFAAGLFALGFLEASVERILRVIDSVDVTTLAEGQPITWRRPNDAIAYGEFIRFNPGSPPSTKPTIEYQWPLKGGTWKREADRIREFNFSPYSGPRFLHDRAMSRNIEFFREFFAVRHTDLLCNTVPTICMVGRPALWDDLRAHEIAIGSVSGCLDDLLRVSGDNENAAEDVSHFLTRFISPDRDELEELSVDCAVYDGSRSYPKLKNFVSASQNLVVLDRWESGALDSANAFAADCAHAGKSMLGTSSGLQIPETIEYAEWCRGQS